MKQDSQITRSLAAAQEAHAAAHPPANAVLYRLYTENTGNVAPLVQRCKRYFDGATFLFGQGISTGVQEATVIIEIIGTRDDLQTIVHLAGDIRIANEQTCVLVTWSPVSRLDVTAEN